MICPVCEHERTGVVGGDRECDAVYRVRKCPKCGYKFWTIEIDKDMFERLVNEEERGHK
jgi:transcriptional regulator NrdR family protein